jgi:hypothetical protein
LGSLVSELGSGLQDGKIGKFPIWAVGVVIAGAILVFMLWRNRGKAPAKTGTDATDQGLYSEGEAGVDGLPPGAIGDFLDGNPLDPAYPVGLTPNGIPGPVTNVQWTRLAFDHLIGLGNDPALVERALAKYIQGLTLTAAEQSVVNLAQQAFGAPPEGLILHGDTPADTPPDNTPPAGNPPPTAPPAAPPAAARRYVIVAKYTTNSPPWNSTLSGIAAHYGTSVSRLVQINGIKNPNLIFTGQKIWIDP